MIVVKKSIVLLFITSLFACANPLNEETYYRYLREGSLAERKADATVAEIAYSRALGNVYMGNLGPDREAEALFNLGRMERINGKLDSSLEHLIKSLEIDENINKAEVKIIKSTLGEIAMTLYEKNDIQLGVSYLDRLTTLDGNIFYSEQSKRFIGEILIKYSTKLREQGSVEKATIYENLVEGK